MDSVDDADVVTRSICQVRYVTCTSSKTFGQDDLPKSPIDLDPMQCLGLLSENRYIPMDWQFTSNNNHLKIYPEGPMLINSSETLIQMAINNRWIICVLEIFARKYLKSGELINLFPEWQCGVRTFQLVTPKTHYVTPKIRVFSDFILKVFDNQTPPNSNAKVNLRSHKKTTYKLP